MDKEKLEQLKKINPYVVHDDGTIDSFEQQLLMYSEYAYPVQYPMIIAPDSHSMGYFVDDPEKPLILTVKALQKLQKKHNLSLYFISKSAEMLKESIFASETEEKESKMVALGVRNRTYQMAMFIRENKNEKKTGVEVNELSSLYQKHNFRTWFRGAYRKNREFYKNPSVHFDLKRLESVLPENLLYALSDEFPKEHFNRQDVEASYDFNHKMEILSHRDRFYFYVKREDVELNGRESKCIIPLNKRGDTIQFRFDPEESIVANTLEKSVIVFHDPMQEVYVFKKFPIMQRTIVQTMTAMDLGQIVGETYEKQQERKVEIKLWNKLLEDNGEKYVYHFDPDGAILSFIEKDRVKSDAENTDFVIATYDCDDRIGMEYQEKKENDYYMEALSPEMVEYCKAEDFKEKVNQNNKLMQSYLSEESLEYDDEAEV